MDKKKAKKLNFGFGLIAVAALLLFNPSISLIDVFPDIAAYVMLLLALTKLSDLNEDISVSLKYFRYMILVEIAKPLALIWVFGLSRTDGQNTGILLISFVFAVIDSLILFTAFQKLFDGLLGLSYVNPNSSLIASKKAGKKTYLEKIKRFTLFFVLFKPVMMALPEFSNLATYEYDESKSGLVTIYEYIGILRGMAFVAVAIVGIVWVCKFISFFNRVAKDVEFCDSLAEKYTVTVLPKKGVFIRRGIALGFVFIFLSALFAIDFKVEGVNLTPDFVGALLLISSIFILGRYISAKAKRIALVYSIVYAIATAVSYALEFRFFKDYDYSAVYRKIEAYNSYVAMCAAKAFSMLAFAFMAAALIYLLCDVIKNHTGFSLGEDPLRDEARIKEYHKQQRIKLTVVVIGVIIAIAGDVFATFFSVRYKYAEALSIITSLIFSLTVLKATSNISEEIETKYMLD